MLQEAERLKAEKEQEISAERIQRQQLVKDKSEVGFDCLFLMEQEPIFFVLVAKQLNYCSGL